MLCAHAHIGNRYVNYNKIATLQRILVEEIECNFEELRKEKNRKVQKVIEIEGGIKRSM